MKQEISAQHDCAGCFMPIRLPAEGASHYLFDLPSFAELPAGVLACITSTLLPWTLMLILRFSSQHRRATHLGRARFRPPDFHNYAKLSE